MYTGRGVSSRAAAAKTSSGTALTAVALQDHLIRSMDLGGGAGLRVGARIPRQPRAKRVTRPVVDTGRGSQSMKAKPAVKEKEFVLDAKPPPPTLAQRLGIVDAPSQLLSEDDWGRVKLRSNQRDDSNQTCVICKESFGSGQQVILSCTHVFHRACLEAFERFSGKKSCPLCRKEQYQTRVIYEGARLHRHRAAARIQAWWRGHVVRCWYRKLRDANPPRDPRLRKKFFEEKLSAITDRMVRSLDTEVGDLFSEIERNLRESRQVFRLVEARARVVSEAEWAEIEDKAMSRNERECPICLTALVANGCKSTTESVSSGTTASTSRAPVPRTSGSVIAPCRATVLTSCSHVFHTTCLETFEDLVQGLEGQVLFCPVCRSGYQKRQLER